MKKKYFKPDLEFLDFVLLENIMVDNDPSIEVGEGEDGEEEW